METNPLITTRLQIIWQKNIGTLRFSEETIDRFEKLFALVNSKFD